MEYRALDLTLVSAKGLKNASLVGKMDVYAVASISGKVLKIKTPVDKGGGPNPTWNFPMKFRVDEAAGLQNRLTLVVKIMAVRMLSDKKLGEVHVPMKELLKGVNTEGKAMQFLSYPVRKRSGKPNGNLTFSYKFAKKYSGKASQHQQQPTGASHHPPPPPEYHPQHGAADLSGGLLISTVIAASGCGGGCGGGCGC